VNPAVRLGLFLAAGAVFAGIFAVALAGLHPVGQAQGLPAESYGNTINAIVVPERHISDAVTAINFDIRGFDTLGEEFILFASVMAVLLLLRRQADERDGIPRDQQPDRKIPRASDAVRILSVALVGATVVFGIYVVTHGQVSPGGGFQGGVILASAPLLIYLAGEFAALRELAPRPLLEIGEAAGAAGYVLIGAAAMFTPTMFLYNYLPLGRVGDVFSGGTVALIDLAVGLEVACGFILLLFAFLEETLVRQDPV
jgi:multicomponent Na+:H+ antiporter subunit B